MLNFIVLGQIPGTNLQVDFALALVVLMAIVCAALGYVLVKRLWARAVRATKELLNLELICL